MKTLIYFYWQGTTGNPKGVTLSHHNIVNNSYFVAQRLNYHTNVCIYIHIYIYMLQCYLFLPKYLLYFLIGAIFTFVSDRYFLIWSILNLWVSNWYIYWEKLYFTPVIDRYLVIAAMFDLSIWKIFIDNCSVLPQCLCPCIEYL